MKNKFQISAKKVSSLMTGGLLLAVVGLFQAVSVGFDYNIYLQFDFYFRLFYRVLIIILSYKVAIDFTFDKVASRQEVYDARDKYIEFNKRKKSNFKVFLSYYNEQAKIRAYVDRINAQIYKYEERLANTLKPRKIQKYESMIATLKKLITSESLEQNKDKIKAKYYIVYPSDFAVADYIFTDSTSKTRPEYNKAVTKFNLKNISKYLLISIITGSAIYNLSINNAIEFWINLLTDLMLVATRITQGVANSTVIFDSEYTRCYVNKTDILKEYIEWDMNNPQSSYEDMIEEEKKKIKKEYEDKAREKIKEYIEQDKTIKQEIRA